MRKPKVVVISDTYYPAKDGIARFVEHLTDQLSSKNFEIDFYFPNFPQRYYPGSYRKITNVKHYPVSCIPVPWFSYFFAIPPVKLFASIKSSDVVIINTPAILGISSFFIGKFLDKKMVWFVHHDEEDIFNHTMKTPRAITKALLRFGSYMYRNVHSLAYATEKFKDKTLRWGVDESNLHLVNFGVTPFKLKKNKLKKLKNKLKIKPDEKLVIYIGRLSDEKNVDLIFDVLVELNKLPNTRAVMIGGGYRYGSLLKKNEQLPKDERIKLTGRVTDDHLACYYEFADILISPTYHESYSFTIVEALSFGIIPVVNHAFRQDPLNDGNSVGILDISSAEEIVNKVSVILKSEDLLKAMQKSAKEVASELSWNKFGDKWEKIIYNVIKQNHKAEEQIVQSNTSSISSIAI
jgi:1,2-diacylglycerol 3-alpha-glucosyltransferase